MNSNTSLSQVQPDQNQVDSLDADERHDQAAEAVDQQVAVEDGGRAERAVGDAFQRQRDQGDNDQCATTAIAVKIVAFQ